MIAGLETITSGELYLDDTLMNELPPEERDVAMVFEDYTTAGRPA
jgi:ABC-type sugar transport system ATPase subunit